MNALRVYVLLLAFGAASAFAQEAKAFAPTSTNQSVANATTSALAVASSHDWITEEQIVPALIAGFFTLLGVALGLGWSAWQDNQKENKRIRRTVNQIREELRANLQMLPSKRDALNQIVANLKANRVLPGGGVEFLRSFYTEHFAAMCPYLSEKERNSLHVIYERLRVVDETMRSYESEMRSVMLSASASPTAPNIVAYFTRMQLGKMEDLLKELSVTEGLMRKHLAGEPEDVFHAQSTDRREKQ